MPTIEIKGEIVPSGLEEIYAWWGVPCTTPKMINKQLNEANGQDIEVEINSPGGSVFDANEIYYKLKHYPGNVTIKVIGVAASAASYIATARKSIIYPGAMMMIHNASTWNQGDHKTMKHTESVLKALDKSICSVYMEKTHLSEKEILKMMDIETWMTAEEAVENGFIDEFYSEKEQKTPFNFLNSMRTPFFLSEEMIEKTRNLIEKEKKKEEFSEEMQNFSNEIQTRLRLLNLK